MPISTVITIESLPGIKTVEVQKLKLAGIKTNLDLFALQQKSEQIIILANQTQINAKYLRKWIALADLSRLPNVGSQYCGLLLYAGMISSKYLSQANAPQLHRQILRLQVATLKSKDFCPSLPLVQKWIKEAQCLLRKS